MKAKGVQRALTRGVQKVRRLIYTVSQKVPPLTCYNLDIHDLTVIIFGRSVTEKVRNQTTLCFLTSPI